MPTAFITGISGQDGSYLADLLLQKGYRVVGLVRNAAADHWRLSHIRNDIELVEGQMLDEDGMRKALKAAHPQEIYNLAARASSTQLFDNPVATGDVNGLAVLRLLEAIRTVDPDIRFCQASSSELFGKTRESPQSEITPFYPRNPYGVAKQYAHWITVNYRETHGLFACSSIVFNHESPRRGEEFVTRKISRAVAAIKAGILEKLPLGDLEARRDWGYAGDYVRAMWLMLQASQPDDFVIATGETHSVRDFCRIAFGHVGLDYQAYVVHQPESRRGGEATQLVGNAAKARNVLGWRPTVSFEELVCMMVEADVAALGAKTS